MPRVFLSYHYKSDHARATLIRNMGIVNCNKPVSPGEWEAVTGGGDDAIARWIAEQMDGRTCAIILFGAETATRPWVKHEIREAWKHYLGVLGIYVDRLKGAGGSQSVRGDNPLDFVTLGENGTSLASIAKTYNPPFSDSRDAYQYIQDNLEDWVEEAVSIRDLYTD